MREIGISPRFSRDKFVPLQTKQRYSTRDISGEVSLTLFFRGFVPFLSLADFVSRNKNLQVADLQRLKSCFGELVTATTSNHQKDMRFTYVKTIYLCHRRHIWAKALIGAYEAQTSTTYPSVVHQWINLSTCFMNKTISSQHK